MTRAEEAGLRTAIAEREQRLVRLLQQPSHIPVDKAEADKLRAGIERLRRELEGSA